MNRKGAAGVDQVSMRQYGEALASNVADLVVRLNANGIGRSWFVVVAYRRATEGRGRWAFRRSRTGCCRRRWRRC